MKKSDLIVPLLTSLGIGAATFYTMSKNNNSVSKTVENVAPILSNLNGDSSEHEEKETLGPHGMS
ncbi:MAG TPA: hypothetical protein VFF20_07120 [Pseudogracilibacillus sp.]|nr:hypothetical protein [Pseudogracilibacillus sp.]